MSNQKSVNQEQSNFSSDSLREESLSDEVLFDGLRDSIKTEVLFTRAYRALAELAGDVSSLEAILEEYPSYTTSDIVTEALLESDAGSESFFD